jgi:hypothetical protein
MILPPPITDSVILIRGYLQSLTDEERLELKNILFQGYCDNCGRFEGDEHCYCWNDE